ncbi:tyrosine-type recombinase/integrase (plasmid) [Serratia sp. AXJ-M]|uniref:tyrosine-type DNA invertase n=1 Tax=Serratia sp. AXJ-M TaxID=2754727 RepID=UPI00397A3F98
MRNERKYLTASEIERILSVVSQAPNAARNCCLIYMCYIHGFRVSEICRLTCQDIDMDEGVINVRRLKNGLSTVHPLEVREKDILARWLTERITWSDGDSPWVFLSQKGGPLSRQQFYVLLRKYGEKAGIGVHPHPHMLRHSCGYLLADLGTDTRLIQDYLGHRNIRHTVLYTASNAARFARIWKKENEINEALWTKL